MSQFDLINSVRAARESGESKMNAAQSVFDLFNSALRAGAFQYHLNKALSAASPQIDTLRKRNFGVLLFVLVNKCDDGENLFGGLQVVGGGNTPWQAYQSFRPSLWNECSESASLWLWYTAFGMSVESPESIKVSGSYLKNEQIRQSIIDSIRNRYGYSSTEFR